MIPWARQVRLVEYSWAVLALVVDVEIGRVAGVRLKVLSLLGVL